MGRNPVSLCILPSLCMLDLMRNLCSVAGWELVMCFWGHLQGHQGQKIALPDQNILSFFCPSASQMLFEIHSSLLDRILQVIFMEEKTRMEIHLSPRCPETLHFGISYCINTDLWLMTDKIWHREKKKCWSFSESNEYISAAEFTLALTLLFSLVRL